MLTNDFYLSILIVVIFFILSINGILITHYELIKKHWSKMKCNPLVMPFAGFFGEDPLRNFENCIKDIQIGYMDIALRPLNINIGFLSDIGTHLLDAIVNVRQMLNFLRNSLMAITASIFSIFSNVIVEFQKLSIGIRDSISKMVAVMFVMTHTLNGTTKTMRSAWRGPPGKMLRDIAGMGDFIRTLEIDPFADAEKDFKKVGKGFEKAGEGIKGLFCFHPETLLLLDTGDYVKMKHVKIGSKLKNGSIVNGVLKLNNLDNKGNIDELLYALPNGENERPVLVTGKHLIYYNNKLDFVKNHPHAKITNINTKKLSCLITSDHHIHIGNYVFWDWEDTEEMRKDLK
tara:strand:+ start:13788 stop:14822 length:1035 start_codon:yes stop_codon:yes gene_type:complete